MKRVITFGTFDVIHVGHINILKRAKELGDYLVVGVSSDELNYSKKCKYPVLSINDRLTIISSIKYVNKVFIEHSLEEKRNYCIEHSADILVMGDDWKGKFDNISDICEVIYLPRTKNISSSALKEQIRSLR